MSLLTGNRQTVLVVDDEPKILDVVTSFLEAEDYRVVNAKNGAIALKLFDSTNPDLVILDIMLPDIDGMELCKKIRKKSKIPIIMLTARIGEEDTIQCLDSGADDYVNKPFSPRALMGRVRAVMRRYSSEDQLIADNYSFDQGKLEINCVSHEILIHRKPVSMTPVEFKIIEVLSKNPKRVFTREDLILSVYGHDYVGNDRSIDTHIKNLRQKVEDDPKNPRYILTVHGLGYRFGGDKS
ncbi:MAG: response regulator transcription factor [Eubacteriales bacterium]